MNSEPATGPAKLTAPSAGARIGVPNVAAMSIPRCPALYGVAGGTNGRTTAPWTGHRYWPKAGEARAGPAGPATTAAAATRIPAATAHPAGRRVERSVVIGCRFLPGHPEVSVSRG